MVETAILAFMTSGAFLGVVYLDIIYQMIGLTIVLKLIYRREQQEATLHVVRKEEPFSSYLPEETAAAI